MSDKFSGLARFIHRIGRLKSIPRTGWLDRGVSPTETESVADHSFRTALLAWLAAAERPDLERDRVLKLALIHDLAESLTGDLPPYDAAHLPDATDADARRAFLNGRHIRGDAQRAAKHAAEAAAMVDLLADLPPPLAAEIDALWNEAASRSTAEARFVKQIDMLETYLQSREYLAADPARPMASFAAEVAELLTDPPLTDYRDAIRRLPDGRQQTADDRMLDVDDS